MVCTQFSGGRLLLLADAAGAPPQTLLAGWDVLIAGSLEHARFLQQFDPFDVVLVDHAHAAKAERDNLGCLTSPGWTSLIVLADSGPEAFPPQAGQGPQHWLPRQPALDQPALLAVVLSQAAQMSRVQRLLQRLEQALQISRNQVSRLVDLLWQGLPTEEHTPWLTQRRLLERLGEEVTRSWRYAVPLSVVLGEMDGNPPQPPPDWANLGELTTWMAWQVNRSKRRCDVAGQYGPNGFLLLLPETTDEGASSFCRRLLPFLQRTEELPEGVKVLPRIRFATASLSPAAATAQSLLSRAEERLTKARQQS